MRHAEDAQDSSMTAFKLLKTEWVLVGVRGKTSLLSLVVVAVETHRKVILNLLFAIFTECLKN